MENKKGNLILYLSIVIFGGLGAYLTFVTGNTNRFDSQTKAYSIDENESSDMDGTTYHPTYYFRVNGTNYECKAKTSSSSYPDKDKNTVYYDSKNPENCLTEYEKSSGRFAGIICLVVAGIILYFGLIKKPSTDSNPNQMGAIDPLKQQEIAEKTQKAFEMVDKVSLIIKRVILGIVIGVLLILILIDTAIFKQTIKSKNYIETTATFVDREHGSVFDECRYTFKDKEGNDHEITVSVSEGSVEEDEIKIKYNENDPQDYYDDSSTMNKTEMIWYVVKIIAVILLIMLFCSKKALSKIGVSVSKN